MKNKFKLTIPLAIIVTLAFASYQRMTGPTYPKKFTLKKEQEEYKVRFLRSHDTTSGAPVKLPYFKSASPGANATLFYKRFPTNDNWTSVPMTPQEDVAGEKSQKYFMAILPAQPAAGKLQYYVQASDGNWKQDFGSSEDPVVIRFKGEVPLFILAPHVFFMFVSMLLCVLAAFEAKYKTQAFRQICFIATGSLFVGGMILGPLVQKHAFNVYWAGFPYDWDLTDNKLLISMIFLALASVLNIKKARPWAVLMAAVVMLGTYSIPHSRMGSQFNYEKGKIITDK